MSNRGRLRWTLLALAALALQLATIALFHRTGHSRAVQVLSIATGVIVLVGVPAAILTLLFARALRAQPVRRWGSFSMALLLLASGALALGYRYRFEHVNGETILRVASVFALLAGVHLAGLVINRRTSLQLKVFGSFSIAATTIAQFIAWSWNPCRFQYCADVGMDGSFALWMGLAAALVTASAWIAYCAARPDRRARWALRFVGLVVSMYLGAAGTMIHASHFRYTGFTCGPLLPYDAPTPPRPAISPIVSSANSC